MMGTEKYQKLFSDLMALSFDEVSDMYREALLCGNMRGKSIYNNMILPDRSIQSVIPKTHEIFGMPCIKKELWRAMFEDGYKPNIVRLYFDE